MYQTSRSRPLFKNVPDKRATPVIMYQCALAKLAKRLRQRLLVVDVAFKILCHLLRNNNHYKVTALLKDHASRVCRAETVRWSWKTQGLPDCGVADNTRGKVEVQKQLHIWGMFLNSMLSAYKCGFAICQLQVIVYWSMYTYTTDILPHWGFKFCPWKFRHQWICTVQWLVKKWCHA